MALPEPLKKLLMELGVFGSIGVAGAGWYISMQGGNLYYVGWGGVGLGLAGLAISQGYLLS